MTRRAALRSASPGSAAPGARTEAEGDRPGTAADSPADAFEEVLYHITHDLRAVARPMTIVPGWIREDLDRSGQAPPDSVEEHLRTLETHAARFDRMLLDLRTFSRIGRLSELPERLDLAAEIEAVAGALGLPPAFEVVRRLDVPGLVAPRNDFRRLLQVVIGNAWKHHDRTRGRITVAARRRGEDVRLSVIDDGPGIERRYRDIAFGMMTTLKPRDEVEGSGLGLAIARKIVTRLGGTIEIADPLAPRGTCVLIVLPQPPPADGVQPLAT